MLYLDGLIGSGFDVFGDHWLQSGAGVPYKGSNGGGDGGGDGDSNVGLDGSVIIDVHICTSSLCINVVRSVRRIPM